MKHKIILERFCFLIDSIEITDCIENKVLSGIFVRFSFCLYNQRKFDRMKEKYSLKKFENCTVTEAHQMLIEAALKIGENIDTLKIKNKTLEVMEANRKEFLSGKTKEEKKKEQKEFEQKLRDERLKKMSSREKAKFLEKEEKKRKKNMMKKFKVVKGA